MASAEPISAYPDSDPWCSICGGKIPTDCEPIYWALRKDCLPHKLGQSEYPDVSGEFLSMCEHCFFEEMPPVPWHKNPQPWCTKCGEETDFEEGKWVELRYFDPPHSYLGPTFHDVTGSWLLMCRDCFYEDVDLYLGLCDE